MDQESRRKYILNHLEKNDFIGVKEIFKKFNVSQMTVRRDLNDLEQDGYLIRRYGGAVKSEAVENLFSFNRRVDTNKEQKETICRIASRFIEDNDIVFIDCGTTLFRICRHILKKKRLRIITNSLPVVSELINNSNIRLTFIGGDIVNERKASYGSVAEKTIGEYHVNKAFIGIDGISLKNGLSSYDEKEGLITRRMAENADEVYLLCDSSKIEKDSFYRVAPISIIDFLITEKKIKEEDYNRYLKNNIKIISK